MRGVAGIAFVFLGLVMGYFVLSGKFPSASSSITNTSTPTNQQEQQQSKSTAGTQGQITLKPGQGSGSNSMGLPTVAYMQDMKAAQGVMQ